VIGLFEVVWMLLSPVAGSYQADRSAVPPSEGAIGASVPGLWVMPKSCARTP
jgi:hypothetical protein